MSESQSATKNEPKHEHELHPSHVAMDMDTAEKIWFYVRYFCITGECEFETFVVLEGEEI